MKKSLVGECISLKTNFNKIENKRNIQLLQSSKVTKNYLKALFLKFKSQKLSPKRIYNLTIRNDSLRKEYLTNKNKKHINSNSKERIKVIPKNELLKNKNKLNLINNFSNEHQHDIYFKNQLIQNNRYNRKSFENIKSINLNIKENDIIKEKYKSNNNNIKRKNNHTELNTFKKIVKKKIKTTKKKSKIYYRNSNTTQNICTNHFINSNSSNKTDNNNFISRINNNKTFNSVNISYNNLNKNISPERSLFLKKNINESKLNCNNIKYFRKIDNQTTPITENISRKFSAKKTLSKNISFNIIKNKIFSKKNKKFYISTSNNSKFGNNIQNKKLNIIKNKNIKCLNNYNNHIKSENKLNKEIKVLKNDKKNKIITIKKTHYLYPNYNTNQNSKIKTKLNHNEKNKKEKKNSFINKRNKIQLCNKKNISLSNTKSQNSTNNSMQNNKIIKNKTTINNLKNIIKETYNKNEKNPKSIKKNFTKRYNIKYNKNGVLINKINKKSTTKPNDYPNVKRNITKSQNPLTNLIKKVNPLVNINNTSKSKIKENIAIINNNSSKEKNEKQNNIKNNSIDYDRLKNKIKEEIDINKEKMENSFNNHNYYYQESQKLSNYIKNYYTSNNDYPPSNIPFYKFGRVIGKGAFGKVNLGLHILTGRIVAIKSFNKTKYSYEKNRNKIMNEIKLMKNLKHFSVVKLLDVIENDKYILLIMENILGGDLLTFIKKRNKLPEKMAKFLFKQLLQSIQYIHSKNIVHRDIKLDNILIDLNNNIKLCDFGVGKFVSGDKEILFDQCGTPAYIAPEVLSGEGYSGFPVDLWSCGVVLYSLLIGNIPFKAQNLNELQGLIISGNYKRVSGISKNAKDLLNKLLEIDPAKRINVDEALNHPWFLENNDNDEYKVNLFTKAELILLSKNNIDYRNGNKEELIENFTLENLDTNKFNENKNNITKSCIFAPFNTSYELNKLSFDNYEIKKMKLEKGLMIQNNIILFDQELNALNRQYELNNNGEIDHGVIIENSYEKEINNKKDKNKDDKYIERYFDCDKNNNENITNDLKKEIKNNNTKLIENNEDENIIEINKAKIYNDSNRNKINNMNNNLTYASTMILDEKIIKYMENLGYKKDYIQKCIFNNELNYCHATYYLLLNSSDLIS